MLEKAFQNRENFFQWLKDNDKLDLWEAVLDIKDDYLFTDPEYTSRAFGEYNNILQEYLNQKQ